MHITRFLTLLALALAAPVTVMALPQPALAQQEGADQVQQIELTQKQIDGAIAASPDIEAIMANVKDESQFNAKVKASLDVAAKKHGFQDFGELDLVGHNIFMIMSGIDPNTKKYVGEEAMTKAQIAKITQDKTMDESAKKAELSSLNEQLKAIVPIKYQSNIDLVAKNYDKLDAFVGQAN